MHESQSTSEQVMGTRTGIDVNSFGHTDKLYPKKLSLSPTRLHVIDGDTLSVLVEKKLEELTSKINPSQCTSAKEGSSAGFRSILEDKFHSVISTTTREQDRSFHPNLLSNELDSMDDNCCSSSDNMALNMNRQLRVSLTSFITKFLCVCLIWSAHQLQKPNFHFYHVITICICNIFSSLNWEEVKIPETHFSTQPLFTCADIRTNGRAQL